MRRLFTRVSFGIAKYPRKHRSYDVRHVSTKDAPWRSLSAQITDALHHCELAQRISKTIMLMAKAVAKATGQEFRLADFGQELNISAEPGSGELLNRLLHDPTVLKHASTGELAKFSKAFVDATMETAQNIRDPREKSLALASSCIEFGNTHLQCDEPHSAYLYYRQALDLANTAEQQPYTGTSTLTREKSEKQLSDIRSICGHNVALLERQAHQHARDDQAGVSIDNTTN